MKHQWMAYVIVALLSIGAGVAIAGLPDNVPVDATIIPPTTTEAPEPTVARTTGPIAGDHRARRRPSPETTECRRPPSPTRPNPTPPTRCPPSCPSAARSSSESPTERGSPAPPPATWRAWSTSATSTSRRSTAPRSSSSPRSTTPTDSRRQRLAWPTTSTCSRLHRPARRGARGGRPPGRHRVARLHRRRPRQLTPPPHAAHFRNARRRAH